MESIEEMKKRIREWDQYIRDLREKKSVATDPEKRRFLNNKIRWATWNKKKLEEHLFDGGIK
jgi:predicted  nucleic acid-binding Zn-ribbon protein